MEVGKNRGCAPWVEEGSAGGLLPRCISLVVGALLALSGLPAFPQSLILKSASGGVEAEVRGGARLALEIRRNGEPVARVADIELDVEGAPFAYDAWDAARAFRRSVDEIIRPAVPEKRAAIPDHFREARIALGPGVAFELRVYDDGVAYRFVTNLGDSVTVRNEGMRIELAEADTVIAAFPPCPDSTDCFHSSYEENYLALSSSDLPPDRLAFLPLVARTRAGLLLVSESDLRDYPGLWVAPVPGDRALAARFAAYPLEEKIVGDEFKQRRVVHRADYIARTAGTRTFPWRLFGLAERDADLLLNDLVYRLAEPQRFEDASWIQPGQSTEEWITSRLLYGVDFVSGLNTETYRHLIDFAADFGLRYMMFDAGWSDNNDLLRINPDIDVPGLVAYARERNVGILLWNLSLTLDRQLELALDRYAAWGVKGILVDFMDRDDQKMVRFYERVAREAAARKLLVNFHGAFKPTGLRRTYPNVITREAVLGHEYNMWSDRVTPDHALTVPFIRMTAGPLDWEGGCMTNGTRDDFRVVFQRPMSQGTRVQQLAQYVVYESPLQYLAASVSDYEREPDFTRVLTRIPTTWDETIPLDGRLGDYVLLARRSGRTWYVAAMTDWTPRSFRIPLDFLGPGTFEATLVADGANAHRYAADYRIDRSDVSAGDTLEAHLAPGGGWFAEIRPR